tara:strand:+ start:388 stop:1920 length:1533 start_codon:yes stop_codon:yes gene_type:complete
MATLQITQIPTEVPASPYTGTANTYPELVPTNYWPILPITIRITDNLSSFYKVKYILRVYQGSISDANLLATVKQRTNNSSASTNQVAIFDVRNIINTKLKATYNDADNKSDEIHTIGKNTTSKIFSKNNSTVKTIVFKATWERSTTASGSPVEQTGGTDEVQITMYFTNATFKLFSVMGEDSNPLTDYNTQTNLDYLHSNAPEITDTRMMNLAPGGSSGLLSGLMNYITETQTYHTIAFQNKSAWGSDGDFLGLQYYEPDGTLMATYTFPNDATRGGVALADADTDPEYFLFAGCGSANFESYNGQAHKDGAALSAFDGQPSSTAVRDYAYYRVYLCANQNGTSSIRSKYYYFVKEYDDTVNCQKQDIIRLGWINELGAWDYYNFNGGQVETLSTERQTYSTMLGSSALDSGSTYIFDTWGAGTRTLTTRSKLKSQLQTQYIDEAEAQFLETLFNSTIVMQIQQAGVDTFSQSVVITDKSFQRRTKAKDRLQIQYTFTIEYSNPLNTNS